MSRQSAGALLSALIAPPARRFFPPVRNIQRSSQAVMERWRTGDLGEMENMEKGKSMFPNSDDGRAGEVISQCSLNSISTTIRTGTGLPSFSAGSNRERASASTAARSSPCTESSDLVTSM
jgi:hypothetical protein